MMETEQYTRTPSVRTRRTGEPGAGEHALPVAPRRGEEYDARFTGGMKADGMANFLGWFSIGLGVAQLVMPDVVNRVIGVDENRRSNGLMRAIGVREIGHGVTILANQRPEKGLWSRVAGDALDLALLGRIIADPRNDRSKAIGATLAVLGVTALDYYAAKQVSQMDEEQVAVSREPGVFTKRSITVNRPVNEVYRFWRNFENLPRFMRHLESVTTIDASRSRWVAKAPAGKRVEWEAVITNEVENELISWRSTENADVYNEGTVRFQAAPGGRGTEVRVAMRYEPPGGVIGSKIAMLWREEPGQQIQDDLRRFKQIMEIGEVVVSDATYRRGPHPAQPPAEV